MRVFFSHHIFQLQSRGGISRYIIELHSALLGLGKRSTILAGPHTNDQLVGVKGVLGFRIPTFLPDKMQRVGARLWAEHLDTSALLPAAAINHLTYYPKSRSRGRVAVTVYDMIHEIYPRDFDTNDTTSARKRSCCKEADIVFVISNTTRKDLLEHFSLDPARVILTPLGVTRLATLPDTAPPRERPYLLYVGSRREPYKNFWTLVDSLKKEGLFNDLELVCFGGGQFSDDEKNRLTDLRVADSVRRVQGSDALLASYYRYAKAYICPSLYEGFGLPVLEAMSLGCPVTCARVASLPEVAGIAAEYFDPTSGDEMGAVIRRVVESSELRVTLEREGQRRVQKFSWDATARSTLAGYELVNA